jgi:hypothetical protein
MTKDLGFVRVCFSAVLLVSLFSLASRSLAAQTMCSSGVCVKTWQQDTGTDITTGYAYRTGQNLNESVVTAEAFKNNSNFDFGQLCSQNLDGQVYAQPLVLTYVTINGHPYHKVAYVVTQKDTIYALQADPSDTYMPACTILNSQSLLLTGQYPVDCAYIGARLCGTQGTVVPTVGILGTPVINVSVNNGTGTIYLVTETQNVPLGQHPTAWSHWLHAVDAGSFTEQDSGPVEICASGCGVYTTASKFSQAHIQRPGLLYGPASLTGLANDIVYIAFSMMDGAGSPYPNGTVFAYNASNLSGGAVASFATSGGLTAGSNGGGIWMGGAAPAFGKDANGKNWIYFTTANGTWDGATNWGDSFLQLDDNLLIAARSGGSVYGYLTAADQFYRSDASCYQPQNNLFGGDVDYGSGGVMLLPDNELANWGFLAVNGEKEGGLWFVDRTNPGGFNGSSCNGNCTCTQASANIQTVWTGAPFRGNTIHNNPAFWEKNSPLGSEADYVYVAVSLGPLIQYQVCPLSSASAPVCNTSATVKAMYGSTVIKMWYGVTPNVSAASSTDEDAIVWVLVTGDTIQFNNPLSASPGILYAFDAVTMTQLYASSGPGSPCPTKDTLSPAAKFSVPTVANGYVYVGTESANLDQSNTGFGAFYIFGPGRTC